MKYFTVMSLLYGLALLVNLELAQVLASHLIIRPYDHPVGKYIWMIVIYFVAYFLFKLLTNRISSSGEALQIVKANILSLVTIFSILFVLKRGEEYSRFIVLAFFMFNMLIPLYISALKQKLFRLPWLRKSVLVIADAESLSSVQGWLQSEFSGLEAKELLLDNEVSAVSLEAALKQIGTKYFAAAIALNSLSVEQLFDVTEVLRRHFGRVIVVPNLGKFPMMNAKILGSADHKGVAFSIPNNLLNPYDRLVKNIFDYTLAVILIILMSPIIMLLYGIVFISSGGRPVFTQQRIGHGGKPFRIYKFTTMYPDADERLDALLKTNSAISEEWEREHKLKNDPRVTRLGQFLRKTSLDELPQFYNVIRGEMSLVGPRPIIREEIGKYSEYFHQYTVVKPGITGLWQVSGRNDIDYEERVQLDVWYVRNWSVDLDLMILFKTFGAVVRGKGSY